MQNYPRRSHPSCTLTRPSTRSTRSSRVGNYVRPRWKRGLRHAHVSGVVNVGHRPRETCREIGRGQPLEMDVVGAIVGLALREKVMSHGSGQFEPKSVAVASRASLRAPTRYDRRPTGRLGFVHSTSSPNPDPPKLRLTRLIEARLGRPAA